MCQLRSAGPARDVVAKPRDVKLFACCHELGWRLGSGSTHLEGCNRVIVRRGEHPNCGMISAMGSWLREGDYAVEKPTFMRR